jgi:hypothetical protein
MPLTVTRNCGLVPTELAADDDAADAADVASGPAAA